MKGVSTSKVAALARAMGASGVSKREVSRLVAELDADLPPSASAASTRPRNPYARLNALYEKVRDAGRIVNSAFLVAIAANERGEREVIGCADAAAESVWVSTKGAVRSPRRVQRLSRSAEHSATLPA